MSTCIHGYLSKVDFLLVSNIDASLRWPKYVDAVEGHQVESIGICVCVFSRRGLCGWVELQFNGAISLSSRNYSAVVS